MKRIKLKPYNALAILSFLREFINDENCDVYQFRAIHEAVSEFEEQVYSSMTNEDIEEFRHENQINQLIGKSPKR